MGSTACIGRNEMTLDRARRLGRQHGEIVLAEHDQLAGCRLVAPPDLLVGHLGAVDRADPLVLHPATVTHMDLGEGTFLLSVLRTSEPESSPSRRRWCLSIPSASAYLRLGECPCMPAVTPAPSIVAAAERRSQMAIGTNSNILAILADLCLTKGPAAAPIQPAAHPDPARTRSLCTS